MLNPRKLYTYFSDKFVLKKSTNGWFAFENPFDLDSKGKKKMAINFGYQWVKCWKTDWSGTATDFIMEYEEVDYFGAKGIIDRYQPGSIDILSINSVATSTLSTDIKMPFGYTPIMYGEGVLGKRARNYLEGRNFSLEVLDRMGIGYCNKPHDDEDQNYFGYIIIPFKVRGQLQYYIGRDYIDNFLRYKNPPKGVFGIGKADIVFNEDALSIYRRVFVLEGWTDALTIGKEAIATLGWSVSQVQKSKLISSNCDEIVFIPDVGKYKEAMKLASQFIDIKDKVKVLNVDELSPFGDDANEIGKEKIMDLYERTPYLSYSQAFSIMMSL